MRNKLVPFYAPFQGRAVATVGCGVTFAGGKINESCGVFPVKNRKNFKINRSLAYCEFKSRTLDGIFTKIRDEVKDLIEKIPQGAEDLIYELLYEQCWDASEFLLVISGTRPMTPRELVAAERNREKAKALKAKKTKVKTEKELINLKELIGKYPATAKRLA